MSAVNNNAFTSRFPVMSVAASDIGAGGTESMQRQSPRFRDSIGPNTQAVFPMPGDGGAAGWSGSNGATDSGLTGFNAIMNGFVNALQNMLASIGGQFGFAPGSGPSATPMESHFMNATANSVGDPHETFDATPSSGAKVDRTWDSMDSHSDLLDSDSIDGGYRVSTSVTAPNDRGVSMNAQAEVALDGGATKITMNADGSYSVFSNGRETSLERGRTESLGNGESVTLDADSSLSVRARNGSDGSLVTKLRAQNGGVDVENTATNVDLGGYLVTPSDDARANPGFDEVSQAPIFYAYDAPTDEALKEPLLRTA